MDLLQWIGAAFGIAGAWLVASERASVRWSGFACFLTSNAFWIGWACAFGAWGLLAMQLAFCATSLRGLLVTGRRP